MIDNEHLMYVLALEEARLLLKDFVRNLSDSAVVCPPRGTFEKAKRWLAENEETLRAACSPNHNHLQNCPYVAPSVCDHSKLQDGQLCPVCGCRGNGEA